ncbi:TPR-like protein [Cryphonectria parasitica EP155]|uniref:TPR-like protein n=1 Tax=Cryphonectria parasitica (strain ATCC 38755 / EP155) TaxID=660469 RepID=A0A9P4Y2Z0_CRYP1|nr:TPR-like protein [Cryphonectria parasitica EP155]KAF3766012.1 TPR-like protein [Cryphonectria parasitica EP155]
MAQDPRALVKQAEALASKASGGFKLFGGREDKWQDAADTFSQAANAFKMQKQNREAGQTFERAAEIQRDQLKELDDAANTYVDAFKAYRNDSPDDAARCLEFSINQYCTKGNFRRAASHKENLGELFETQLGDTRRACEAYEMAAGWYEGDGAAALANKLWLKVADISALDENYSKSIEIYEKVAGSAINNNLMRYSVKEYFFKAGLCHLANKDMILTQRALEHYRDMDPTFAAQREHQLLVDLVQTIEDGDQEKFSDKLYAYDQISKLDKWKTSILLKIKGNIEAVADNEFS